MTMMENRLVLILIIISIIGLGSGILSYKTYKSIEGGNTYCVVGGGCRILYSVPESRIFGIHFSVLAPIYFTILVILAIALYLKYNKIILKTIATLYFIGILFVPYLISIEYKYHEICAYCTIMHAMIILGTITNAIILYKTYRTTYSK